MRTVTQAVRRGRHRRRIGALVPAAIATGLLLLGIRLLALIFVVFQHAYLNSYWLVPGYRAGGAYWGSIRFAIGATVLVSVAMGLLAALALAELVRAAAR